MKTRENQLLYWFHPSFSFSTEWTHFFLPYNSATPAGRRRRQHIRAQVRHARTRRRSSTLSRVLDDEQGDGELRGDEDAKGGVTPPSRFLLSLSKHLIHCHLQTEKIAVRINSNRMSFHKMFLPQNNEILKTWSETRLYYTLDVIVSSKQIKFSVLSHLWEGLVEKSRCDVFLMNLPIHAW